MLIWVPLCELRKESPYFGIIGVEDVRAIGVDINGVFVKIVETVSAYVVSSIDNRN